MDRADSVREQMDRILADPLFSAADRRARLLRFLVEESLKGQGGSLKESLLALEVFGRTGNHDPKVDSVVRVEMGRLRSRLIEYYAQAGQRDPVRIEIPKGRYEPVFVFKKGDARPPAETAPEPPGPRRRYPIYLVAACILALGLAILAWKSRPSLGTSASPSVAVLPFLNFSKDGVTDYLADSLADELTEILAESTSLRVVARTSAFQFKGRSQDVREIGRRLNATDILEGSLQQYGDQLRLVVQLIRSSDSFHIWSHIYDTPVNKLAQVEAQVAAATARALLPGNQDAASIPFYTRTNPEAHDLYLRAAYLFHQGNPESLKRAADLTRQAIQLDPSFVRAHLLLAKIEQNLASMNVEPQRVAWERSQKSLEAVLALDPSSSEAHASLALHAYVAEWDWAKAEHEFQLALAPARPPANAHSLYGWSLMTRKRFDEARSHFAAALEIDPLSVAGSRTNMATDWILERNYSKARQVIDGMFELNPKSVAASGLSGWIQLIQGDCPGLRVTLGQVERWNPGDLERAKALFEAKCGQPNRARAMLADLEKHMTERYVSPYLVAWAYSILGEADKAVDRLDEAADNHDSLVFYIKLDPLFDTIRSQPRFQDLADRIGLPQ